MALLKEIGSLKSCSMSHMPMDFQKFLFDDSNRSIHLMNLSVSLGLPRKTLDLLKYQMGMDC